MQKKQLSLGELIKILEAVKLLSKEEKIVRFDFGTAIPDGTGSWRGDYSEIELNYILTGYDNGEHHMDEVKLTYLIKILKDSVGREFTGWKGGEFVMQEDTRLWVSNAGNASHTGITGIIDKGYEVILETAHFDY